MTHPNVDSITYYLDKLQFLLGGTVTKVLQDELEPEYYGLCIEDEFGKEYHLWFLSDDEGNYPGSFDLIMENDEDATT